MIHWKWSDIFYLMLQIYIKCLKDHLNMTKSAWAETNDYFSYSFDHFFISLINHFVCKMSRRSEKETVFCSQSWFCILLSHQTLKSCITSQLKRRNKRMFGILTWNMTWTVNQLSGLTAGVSCCGGLLKNHRNVTPVTDYCPAPIS